MTPLTEVGRAVMSAKARARWADPEFRTRVEAKIRAVWAEKKTRARKGASKA